MSTTTARPATALTGGPGAGPGTGSVLRPVGPHLVIAPAGDGDDPLAEALRTLPPTPGALLVLAAAPDAAPVLRRELPALARLAAERHATTLVLAASGLAAAASDGRRPCAAVARAVGLPVLAPDGLVSVETDGTLLVTDASGAGSGSWWLTEPDGRSDPVDARWPATSTEPSASTDGGAPPTASGAAAAPTGTADTPTRTAALPTRPTDTPTRTADTPTSATDTPTRTAGLPTGDAAAPTWTAGLPTGTAAAPTGTALPAGVSAVPFPGGCWLTAQGAAAPPTAVALAVAEHGTRVVAVGSPDEPRLSAAELVAAVGAQSEERGELLLSAPWAEPSALVGMAVALADHLDRDVRAAVGLSVATADGHTTTFLDLHGSPTWEPVLLALTASPARGRVVSSVWRRLPKLEPLGPAMYRALEGWVLEAVPAGLWLRPEGPPHDTSPRLRQPDPRRPLLIVGERHRPVGEQLWSGLGPVLEALPDFGADHRLGLLLYSTAGTGAEAVGRFLTRLHTMEWLGSEEPPQAPSAPGADGPGTARAAEPEPPVAREFARTVVDVPLPPLDPAPAAPGERAVPDEPTTPHENHTSDHRAAPDHHHAVPDAPAVPDEPTTPHQNHTSDHRAVPDAPAAPDERAAPDEGREQGGRVDAHGMPPSGSEGNTAHAASRPGVPSADGRPEDREALKALLGSRYHRLASRTDLLTTRLPGLRSAQRGDVRPGLVAVLVHHCDSAEPASRADLVAAARGAGDGPLTPVLRCLGPGLRMLPSHHGAVLLGAPADDGIVDAYRPGSVLTEPAPVAGVPAHDVGLGTAVEFGVWSTTGRRTAVFGGPAEEPEVVFLPQSRFSVLAVVPGDEEGRPVRVLLREMTSDEAEPASRERDRQAHERLLAWFERRDGVPPHERRRLTVPERFHLTPGVHPG